MSFLGRLAAFSEKAVELSAEPDAESRSEVSVSDPLMFERLGLIDFNGPNVGETQAMNFAAVFRAVSIIASNIAGLEYGAYRVQDGVKQRVPSFLDNPYRPIAGQQPVLSPFEFYELMLINLLLHGNFYAEKLRNVAGEVIALSPIHPSHVQVEWNKAYQGGKKYRATDDKGVYHYGGSERFVHIMGISLNGLTGISVITAARMGIGIGLVGDESAYKMFDRGATISGLVTPADGEELDDDDVEKIRRNVRDTMTGADNTGNISVVNRRLAFTRWTMSAQDAQFLESRTFQIDEVGRWFGIPSHLLNLSQKSTSWGPGIEQQNIGLARYTLQPWTDRIASRLTMLVPNGQHFEFSYERFLRPEPEKFIASIIQQIDAGILTPNEGRQMLNRTLIPNGDIMRGGDNAAANSNGSIGSEPVDENPET